MGVRNLNFAPKRSRDVVLAMTSTISKWLNLSVRGEEKSHRVSFFKKKKNKNKKKNKKKQEKQIIQRKRTIFFWKQ